MKQPLFTIIMLTFNRPHFLRQAVESFFAQTYTNLEIIIIDNASTPETREYLAAIEQQDRMVKLVHFQTNQYDPNKPCEFIRICHNAALKIATGDYVLYMEDDDLLGPEYVERLVALFEDNPQCTTAGGVPVAIDEKGEIIAKVNFPNYRPRYMPGHLMILDKARSGKSILFNSMATVLAVKRAALLKEGGFHPQLEVSYLYGIVPFGVTGFDEKAVFYWRRHPGELNRVLTAGGHVGLQELQAVLKDWDIPAKWENKFGKESARLALRSLQRGYLEDAAVWFSHNCFALSWLGAGRILGQAGGSGWFWRKLPQSMWDRKWVLKDTLKRIFGIKG